MNITKDDLLLYAVTDRAWLKQGETLAQQVEAVLCGGATCVQLREKKLDMEAFLAEAREMKALCARYGVPLIINDRVDIALAAGADGVHIGQDDGDIASVRQQLGADKMIGVSAHSVAEAIAAERAGADYLGCGAVFGTASKQNTAKLEIGTLREICAAVQIPVVAIGGVTRENIMRLAGTGIAGPAVISALFAAEDKQEAAREMLAFCRMIRGGGV